MTSDGVMVLNFVFKTIWTYFTSWQIPGTHTTPAGWAFFSLSAVLAIRIARIFLGLPHVNEYDTDMSTRGPQSGGSSGSNYGGAGM